MSSKMSTLLALLVSTLLVLAFGVFSTWTSMNFKEQEDQRFQDELDTFANIAKTAFITPLKANDTVGAQSLVTTFTEGSSIIKKMEVYDQAGSLIAKYQHPQHQITEGLTKKRVPLALGGAQYGEVFLYFSREKVISSSENLKHSILMSIAFFTLTLIFITSQFLRRTFDLQRIISERTAELDGQRLQMAQQSRLAALGEFSAGVAHEINNPLAVIGGKSMIIKRKIEGYPELASVKSDLDKISGMVNRISRIIVGLRNFSRDSSAEEKVFFSASQFLDDVQDLCQTRMDNRGIAFSYSVEPKDLKLYAREVQISQVLINLINNSIDALEQVGDKWIEVKVRKEQTSIHIQVRDSGPGIPTEVQEKIFQPFFTTKETGRGTGIGLSISMGFISSHGGELRLDQSAKNTTFVIRLPLAPTGAA